MMNKLARLFLIVMAVVFVSRSVPVSAQESLAMRIYKLAQALHNDDLNQQNFTLWVNGNMGGDAADFKPAYLEMGQPMPDFNFALFDGSAKIVGSDLKPPYLLNFWASWCGPCRQEFPLLLSHIKDGTIKQQVIFVDTLDSRADAEAFLEEIAVEHNMIATDDAQSSMTKQVFGIGAIPQTILVDAGGNIQAIHIGNMSEASIAFFTMIAEHPGIGAFDQVNPDEPPADLNPDVF
jgi:thiol-disulfide isomerase/thioredoxin